MRYTYFLLFAAAFLAMVGGCSRGTDRPAGPDKPAATVSPVVQQDSKQDLSGLDELAPADREAARGQAVCPVTGEKLGSMGKPVKISVKGRTVFLCCEGCKEAIEKDPEKYLAKLDASQAKK